GHGVHGRQDPPGEGPDFRTLRVRRPQRSGCLPEDLDQRAEARGQTRAVGRPSIRPGSPMRGAIVWTAAVLLCAATAHAAEPPKIAAIGDLPLERGGTIKDCRLEYRTLGTLNADRTNAVLFPTWFSGRTENLAGFVGGDQMLDPARHFVILVGAL